MFRRGADTRPTLTIAEVEPEEKVAAARRQIVQRSPAPGPDGGGPSAAQKKELKLKGGVRVVSAEGAAARAGLQEGDVLLALANVELASVKDFEAVLAKVDETKPVNVLVRRGEWAQYVLIRPAR